MECRFRVGQKVTLVDEIRDHYFPANIALPETGVVYTVREVVKFARGVGLRLVEITNQKYHTALDGCVEPAFYYIRFRPAVETQTDISALRQIVADVMAGRVREAV